MREGPPIQELDRNFSIAEYKQIQSSAQVGFQTEHRLFGDNSQLSVQMHGGPAEGHQLYNTLLKPESAQQDEREIYIGGYAAGKQSPTSFISLGDVTIQENKNVFNKKRRKSTLPSIKGVNRNSLGLLIDQPEHLFENLTPMARKGFSTRNNSVMVTPSKMHATFDVRDNPMSGTISPGYQSIVSSARREIKGLNFEIGMASTHGHSTMKQNDTFMGSDRKKNSQALLYGRTQMSRVKLQLASQLEKSDWKDKVLLQQNAVNLIKRATRPTIGMESKASETFGDGRSIGAVSAMNNNPKLKSIIKLKQPPEVRVSSVALNQYTEMKQTTMRMGKMDIVAQERHSSLHQMSNSMPRTAESPTRLTKH